ncbi:MAG: hypothetical protein AMK73_04185 [Planctomycetes bacterium SM23_32]|nr:MAG: hypothetical protein AMK73_04185 [Planctomycetes bacterium SM23_32]
MSRPAALLALLLAGLLAPAVFGIEVWMPETGEVDLDEVSTASVEARREHAMALIGAGQWAGGVVELRLLIAEHPAAEWVPETRFVIARGLLACGRAKEAFEELELLRVGYPHSEFAPRVRPLQFTAARLEAERDVEASMELHERLMDTAPDRQEAAEAQKAKADVLFEAQRFLDAEAEYLAFISLFPGSEHGSYCWYRAAECEWRLATWLGLGLERVELAERHFRDFMDRYPGDAYVSAAREKVEQARRERAALNWQIACYYIDVERKPWAAVSYLEDLRRQFPDTPEAEWAERELAHIHRNAPAPWRGEVREMDLPGAVAAEPEGEP